MDSNGTYSLFPEEADSRFTDKFYLFNDSNDSDWKKKKKQKKKKKKSKSKNKKQSKRDFQYRLIEKSADTALGTASDIAKMYAESKFFPTGHGK